MPRSKVTPLPEPPMVWGPSEVNAWIRDTHPSKRRPHHVRHRRAAKVSALKAKVQAQSREEVRKFLGEVLRDLDFVVDEEAPVRIAATRGDQTIAAKVHHSMRRSVAAVALHFKPPMPPTLPRRVVRLLARRFSLVKMTLVEAKPRQKV